MASALAGLKVSGDVLVELVADVLVELGVVVLAVSGGVVRRNGA